MGTLIHSFMNPHDNAQAAGKADSVRRASAEGLRTQVLARWSDPRMLVRVTREPEGYWSCQIDGPPELIREVIRAYGRTPDRELSLLTSGSIIYRWVRRR